MTKEAADRYATQALSRLVAQICEEIELVLHGDPDLGQRIPQLVGISICCYPPLNIGKDQLVSSCIGHRASS
jgi:hypothetical protein